MRIIKPNHPVKAKDSLKYMNQAKEDYKELLESLGKNEESDAILRKIDEIIKKLEQKEPDSTITEEDKEEILKIRDKVIKNIIAIQEEKEKEEKKTLNTIINSEKPSKEDEFPEEEIILKEREKKEKGEEIQKTTKENLKVIKEDEKKLIEAKNYIQKIGELYNEMKNLLEEIEKKEKETKESTEYLKRYNNLKNRIANAYNYKSIDKIEWGNVLGKDENAFNNNIKKLRKEGIIKNDDYRILIRIFNGIKEGENINEKQEKNEKGNKSRGEILRRIKEIIAEYYNDYEIIKRLLEDLSSEQGNLITNLKKEQENNDNTIINIWGYINNHIKLSADDKEKKLIIDIYKILKGFKDKEKTVNDIITGFENESYEIIEQIKNLQELIREAGEGLENLKKSLEKEEKKEEENKKPEKENNAYSDAIQNNENIARKFQSIGIALGRIDNIMMKNLKITGISYKTATEEEKKIGEKLKKDLRKLFEKEKEKTERIKESLSLLMKAEATIKAYLEGKDRITYYEDKLDGKSTNISLDDKEISKILNKTTETYNKSKEEIPDKLNPERWIKIFFIKDNKEYIRIAPIESIDKKNLDLFDLFREITKREYTKNRKRQKLLKKVIDDYNYRL